MAKFKGGDLDLKTNQKINFDTQNQVDILYDGVDLIVNRPLKGERATHNNHLVRYDQLTETSGILQTQIDNITISGGAQTFIDLNDTPTTYSGYEDKHVYVESDGTGLNFRYIQDNDDYTEIIYTGVFPTQINVYTDSGKLHQISSTAIVRIGGKVTQTIKSIYDINTGTSIVGTLTTTINRVGGRVVSTTSVRT